MDGLSQLFFIVCYSVVGVYVLFFLLFTKLVWPRTVFQWLSLIAATPVPLFIVTEIQSQINKSQIDGDYCGQEYVNVNDVEYIFVRYCYEGTRIPKRIEAYRNDEKALDEKSRWVKDSVWIYFDKKYDTVETVTYRNGVKVAKRRY